MKTQENKDLLRSIINEVNKKNYNALWDNVAPECVIIDHTGRLINKMEFKQYMDEFLLAYPDFNLVIEDLIAEGDKVVVRYTESGTWTGNYMGNVPTGKKMSYPAIEIWRFADGKITGVWMARDILTAATQSGLIPQPEQSIT